MNLDIFEIAKPTDADWQAIFKPLLAYNAAKVNSARTKPLVLILKESERGEGLGGLCGHAYWHWLYIDLLFVPEAARGRGIGSKLMARAEDFARQVGCGGVWLDTFTIQAPEFYRKLGYEAFASLDDYPDDNQRIFFRKRLPCAPL